MGTIFSIFSSVLKSTETRRMYRIVQRGKRDGHYFFDDSFVLYVNRAAAQSSTDLAGYYFCDRFTPHWRDALWRRWLTYHFAQTIGRRTIFTSFHRDTFHRAVFILPRQSGGGLIADLAGNLFFCAAAAAVHCGTIFFSTATLFLMITRNRPTP